MATPYTITAEGLLYTVVDDLTTAYRALITGTVRDELSGSVLSGNFRVQTDRPDLKVFVSQDGLFAVAGYPELAFPRLNAQNYAVTLVISSPGYRQITVLVLIPQNTLFPVPAPALNLRREPVRLQGRVVKAADRSAISNAVITARDDPSAQPPPVKHPGMLRSPLYFAHAAGVTVRAQQLTPSGTLKQLNTAVPAGTAVIALSNRTGISPGGILRIGDDPATDPEVEFAVIDSLAPLPANPALPGELTLRNPLNHTFGPGTHVQAVTAAALPTTRVLKEDADAGDGVLLLDGILDVSTIAVEDPAPALVEYHAVGALSRPDGYYRIDGMARQAAIFLRARAGGFQDLVLPVALNYSQPVNLLDFRLSP